MHKKLKKIIKPWISVKKVRRVMKFNQEAWIKPYIDMNTDLRKKAKNDFEKYFFKLMNNAVFGKAMENVRKHGDIKLVTTEKRRNYLVSEPSYQTTIFFLKIYQRLATEMRKAQTIMNKPVYLVYSYQNVIMFSQNMEEKQTYGFIVYIKTDEIYKFIAEDLVTMFDTSNYELNR